VTGVLGPVQFQVLTRAQWESFPWRGFSLSALAVQVDGFAALEEKYGHAFGAGLLQDVAWLLHFTTREGDLVGREGPAFLCLLPRCDADEAITVVRRLQDSLGRQTFRAGDQVVHVSVGAGIATLDSPRGADLETLFHTARRALAGALAEGPHRFHLAPVPVEIEAFPTQPLPSPGDGAERA
ncbi:MAG TPA: diguanylate cyclase, partial [bacterium]|nr:diguanylate cyclase [bacterium]